MLLRTSCLTLALFTLLPVWSQAQELRYKFQAGSKNSYVMEQKQNMKMNAMGQEFEIKMNMTFEMTHSFDSVDSSGNAKMKQKIDRVKMSMEGGPIGSMEFDSKSDKEPEGPLAAMAGVFKAITDGETKMTVSPRGEISDFKMPEKLLEELKNVAGGAGGFGGNMFSEDQFKNIMNQSMMLLPKEAPTPGSTKWDSKMEMKLGPMGTMKNTMTYTYAGKSGDYDKIDVKLDIKLESDPNAPFQVKMNTKEAGGTTLFDNAKGRIQEVNMKTVSEMEMGAIGTMNMTQTTTMKLK